MEHHTRSVGRAVAVGSAKYHGLIVVLFTASIYLACILSPPHLFDDVDAVQAQIARNMLESGDYVTARLNGVAYLEKSPLIYWVMAASYKVFGVHDWSARLPLAFIVVLLAWTTYRLGRWAFGDVSALYSGLILGTCVGLFLFTRILIPDAALTLSITVALWAFLRLVEGEPQSMRWAAIMGAALGCGLLLKGAIAIVFPGGIAFLYLWLTRRLFVLSVWRNLRLGTVIAVVLLIALPWHGLAILRNPPYFVFSLHSGPGDYKGFFWFYFFNEHLLRFLNLRYPRDYNTVPRLLFWGFTLAWLFPWSVFLPATVKLGFKSDDRASHTRLLALCWIALVMGFFTFSTTQEYYSMPIYPALAILLGSAIASGSRWVTYCGRFLVGILVCLFAVLVSLLYLSRGVKPVGDISSALTQNPEMYTLSLGHMSDLTVNAFAYLRAPLVLAAVAVLIGIAGMVYFRKRMTMVVCSVALMMALFFQAARLAMVTFDAYLGSYPLAEALQNSPPGDLIEGDAYYAFSAVFFYTNRSALLLNGRFNNLEYGSNAPGAPHVFIGDGQFVELWKRPQRYYLLIYGEDLPHIQKLVGESAVHVVRSNAGNYLLTNSPL
ncbi:MAG TPA: glycosyltransferase family 39 protein [Terriglobales bacterium]|nr:glycosyltransferase family 39 protein [Terriglobales bacterium]